MPEDILFIEHSTSKSLVINSVSIWPNRFIHVGLNKQTKQQIDFESFGLELAGRMCIFMF